MKRASLFAPAICLSIALWLLYSAPDAGFADTPIVPVNIYNLSVTDGKGHVVGDDIAQSSGSFSSSDVLQVGMNMSNWAAGDNATIITIIQVRDSNGLNHYLDWWESNLPINQTMQRSFSLPPIGHGGEYMILIHTWSGLERPEQLAREEALLISVEN